MDFLYKLIQVFCW